MAQPNVMREPSMEEILASIRRIIENNEPVENIEHSSFSPQSAHDAETVQLTIDDDIAFMSSAPAVEHAESLVPPAAQPREDVRPRQESQANRPMSLADVAARVKAAADRRAPANDSEHWNQVVPTPTILNDAREPGETVLVPANSTAPSSVLETSFDVTEAVDERAETMEATIEQHVETHDVSEDAATERTYEVSRSVEETRVDPMERLTAQIGREVGASVNAQLLSATAEEKVSRSFDELVEALGGSTRSLDEIAEEMLKPMLQEWLDDNLPTMVERLVREEIERVARGPRR